VALAPAACRRARRGARARELLACDKVSIQYTVTRVAPLDIKPDLLRIWGRNLRVAGDVDDRFRWTYQQAPEAWDHVFVLAAHEGAPPLHLVGTAGVEVRPFAGGGRELRVALGCNLAVDPTHRTLLPGLQLVRAVRRDTHAEFDLTYNFPNERAQALYARAGYHDLGEVPRYVRVLRHAPYVGRYIGVPWLARPVGAAADLASRARRAIGRRRAARAFQLAWLAVPDRRFDALWENARGDYPIVARRDAAWLRWRYLACPGSCARIAALVERGPAAAVRAYAVVEQLETVAHVRDLFGRRRDLDPLLALLLPELRDRGATSASFRYLGSEVVVGVLRAHGFRVRDARRRVCVDAGAALTEDERRTAMNPTAWHLTEYDEDS